MQISRKAIVKHIFLPILLGTGIGLILTLVFNWEDIFSLEVFVRQSFYCIILTFFFWKGNEIIIRYLNKRNSWVKNTRKIMVSHFILGFTYSLVVILLFYMYIWFILMHKRELTGFYQHFKTGIFITFAINLIVNLIVYSYYFFKYWQKSVLSEEKLKREALALQYESLKSNVNPHFLFNSLNTLTSLIELDKDSAIKFVKQLSDVFRYVLDQNVRELVDIDTELRFAESYIYLQQIRFGENIKISVNIGDHRFKIVPIALQLLIENAIKHNTISAEHTLAVSIYDKGDFLLVTNNLQRKAIPLESSGIGLKTLSFQYEFLCNKAIEISEDNGLYTVKLPKI